MKLADIQLSINEKRIGRVRKVYRAPSREELSVEHEEQWLRVDVPELTVHEILVLER